MSWPRGQCAVAMFIGTWSLNLVTVRYTSETAFNSTFDMYSTKFYFRGRTTQVSVRIDLRPNMYYNEILAVRFCEINRPGESRQPRPLTFRQ